jgi:hypothetical protein
MDSLWILAQAGSQEDPSRIGSEPVGTDGQSTTQVPGSPTTGPDRTTPPPKPGSPYTMLLMMIAVFVVMYMLL